MCADHAMQLYTHTHTYATHLDLHGKNKLITDRRDAAFKLILRRTR